MDVHLLERHREKHQSNAFSLGWHKLRVFSSWACSSSSMEGKCAYYQANLLSRYYGEAICQLTYISKIEKLERSHLQVESRHSKFVGTKLVKSR